MLLPANKLGRGTRSEMVGHAIELFKMISPAKRARPEGRAAVCFCINCIVPVKDFGASREGEESGAVGGDPPRPRD